VTDPRATATAMRRRQPRRNNASVDNPGPTMHTDNARRAFIGRIWTLALAGSMTLVGSGCGGKKVEVAPPPPPPAPKPPANLDVTVKAAGNANAGGLPIVVRVYELKSQGAFSSADFFSLYGNETATLADALVSREEMTLAPGRSQAIHKQLSPDAAYLGVLGAFRDIDSAQWRSVVPLNGDTDNSLAVTVGANSIRIQTL